MTNKINLNRYTIMINGDNDIYAYDKKNHKRVHGLFGLKIVTALYKGIHTNKENIDYKHNFICTSRPIMNILTKYLLSNGHPSSLGTLLYLLNKAQFTSNRKPDFTFYPRLYRLHESSINVCKHCNVGDTSVNYLYKALRHYGLAIIHYGNITFSPLLIYPGAKSGVRKSKARALKYYRYLLSQNKYGMKYLQYHNLLSSVE